ncbi:MAG: hypothetical protein JW709_02315 [Sedimentisphaerales bacterium]|nr:hypothetical protein [Sedimentisphaerales bacterium]
MNMDYLITIAVIIVVGALVGWSLWRTLTGRAKSGGCGCSCGTAGKNEQGCCSDWDNGCDKMC